MRSSLVQCGSAAAAAAWLVVGCGGERAAPGHERVELAGRTYQVPARVMSAHPGIRDAYLFALEHPEVLRYVPCYCGCEELGHTSNVDCFIDDVRADGTVFIDEMGFG